jgi:hypothetical protein
MIAIFSDSAIAADDNRLRLNHDGALEQGDQVNDDGCFVDTITVELDKGPAIFRLRSDSFDTVLHVIGADGVVYENDDFGSDRESGLNIAVKIPGSFRILVTAPSPDDQGTYRLTALGYRLLPPGAGEIKFDRIQLESGHALAGKVKFGKLKMSTVFGELDVPGERLLELKRNSSGLVGAHLSDESQIEGWVEGDDVVVSNSGGTELKVPVRQIAQFTAAGHEEAGKNSAAPVPDDGMPWIVSGDTRIGGAWTAQQVDVVGAFGALSLPAAHIAAVIAPDRDYPIGQVILTDGSRLLCRPQAMPLRLKDHDAPVIAGVSVQVHPVKPATGKFVLSLSSGDELVGQFGDLSLKSQFGTFTAAGAEIAAVSTDEGGLNLAITMKSGERLAGQLAEETFAFVTDWNHQVILPSMLIRGASQK